MEFVGEQLAGCGATYRKMFGEYAVYLDGKVVALVCDNRLLVKITPSAEEILPDAPRELPYAGAKPMLLVEDLDNAEFLCALVTRVAAEVPAPKKRNKAAKNA